MNENDIILSMSKYHPGRKFKIGGDENVYTIIGIFRVDGNHREPSKWFINFGIMRGGYTDNYGNIEVSDKITLI